MKHAKNYRKTVSKQPSDFNAWLCTFGTIRMSWEDAKKADFYLQSGEFLQDMWHHLTKERCCYCGQHYLAVVAAHQCLETSNPEIWVVGQKQRHLFQDRNLIFPAAWTDLNTTLWLQFGNVSSQNTSRPLCCNPTPSQQRCFECIEMPPPTKINI